MKWQCPNCRKETAMRFIASKHHTEKCYDYQLEVEVRYYACVKCEKYTQRKFTRTTYMACPNAIIESLKQ